MAFFGLSVKGNASEKFEIPQGAMLTVTQLSLGDAKDGEAATVSLAVEIEGFDEDAKPETKTFQVARLIAGKTDQIKVNFKLFCHEPSQVNVKGAGTVHLVGYLEPDPNFPDDEDDEMDSEDEEALREQMMGGMDSDEEEEEEVAPAPAKKAQAAPAKQAPAKAATQAPAKPQQQQQSPNAGQQSKNQKKKEKRAQKGGQENGQKRQKTEGGNPTVSLAVEIEGFDATNLLK